MVDQCRSLPTDPTHAREAHTLLAAVALCSARPAQGMGSTQRRESPRQLRRGEARARRARLECARRAARGVPGRRSGPWCGPPPALCLVGCHGRGTEDSVSGEAVAWCSGRSAVKHALQPCLQPQLSVRRTCASACKTPRASGGRRPGRQPCLTSGLQTRVELPAKVYAHVPTFCAFLQPRRPRPAPRARRRRAGRPAPGAGRRRRHRPSRRAGRAACWSGRRPAARSPRRPRAPT